MKESDIVLEAIAKFMPLPALEELANVLIDGAEKYPDERWRTLSARKNFASIRGHMDMAEAGHYQPAFLQDMDSGLHPAAHAAARLLFQVARDKG